MLCLRQKRYADWPSRGQSAAKLSCVSRWKTLAGQLLHMRTLFCAALAHLAVGGVHVTPVLLCHLLLARLTPTPPPDGATQLSSSRQSLTHQKLCRRESRQAAEQTHTVVRPAGLEAHTRDCTAACATLTLLKFLLGNLLTQRLLLCVRHGLVRVVRVLRRCGVSECVVGSLNVSLCC
jgi:hypothetical protein